MSGNPMEEQIGRLIGNLLAGGGEVFLPGVGTLYTERRGAQRINRRSVVPPCRVVSFTSQQQGMSLVDEIARVLRESGAYENPEAEAQAVYDRWFARVREENLLTVEGVGALSYKNFTPEEAFDRRLNPQGHEPVRIRAPRRFDWALWIGVAAIAVALVYGGREFLLLWPDTPKTEVAAEVVAEPVADSLKVSRPDALAEAPAVELPGPAGSGSQAGIAGSGASVETTAPERVGTPTHPAGEKEVQKTPMALLSGRHYVVLGVFSTPENAARAVRDAEAKEPGLRCRIYYFGEKFMVSPFSSDDAEVCAQFIRTQGERFAGLWTYTAR